MNRRFWQCLTMLMLVCQVSHLAGFVLVRTPGFSTADITGRFQIFISHASEMAWIAALQSHSVDIDYEGEDDEIIYGWGLGIPVKDKVEIDFWLYGPFWSIWPATLSPSGVELQAKVLLSKEDKWFLSLAPAFVSTWTAEQEDWKATYSDVNKAVTNGIRLPLIYSYRSLPNLNHNLSVGLRCDWVTLRGYTNSPPTWNPEPFKRGPTAVVTGNVSYDMSIQIRAVILNFEVGVEAFEGSGGRLDTAIIWGASLGTVW